MTFETPTSELEAVNRILASVGESPVIALGSGFVDAEQAYNLLQQETRLFLSKGWSFNEETDVVLTPDVTGSLILPANTIRFICKDNPEYAQRGTKVYDQKNHSFTSFTAQVTATLIVLLPFDQLPEALRLYLTTRSARIFQDDYQGDAGIHAVKAQDEIVAKSIFLNHEAEAGQYNVLRDSRLGTSLRKNRRF